jgi:prepilin-type N-terminal cleavage/methylation domain-containing protein/prepilin-type processing-associated H-X9-DG protein
MKRAFTLIELLVVIGIIAILAAVLFPVFVKARERAKRTECISNMKQIGIAISMYCSDYDEKYPWAWCGNKDGLQPMLPEVMGNYVRDEGIWECPSDTGETFRDSPDSYGDNITSFHALIGSSYDYPGRGFARKWTLAPYKGPKAISQVRKPALAPLSYEVRPWHGHYHSTDLFMESYGLYNVLYCDGHVTEKTAKAWFADGDASVAP